MRRSRALLLPSLSIPCPAVAPQRADNSARSSEAQRGRTASCHPAGAAPGTGFASPLPGPDGAGRMAAHGRGRAGAVSGRGRAQVIEGRSDGWVLASPVKHAMGINSLNC